MAACTAPLQEYPSVRNCVEANPSESDKILRRLHEINENLASIRGQLREIEDRILSDQSATPESKCSPIPTPRPVFIDQAHGTLDDSFNYISDIRQVITKLQRF